MSCRNICSCTPADQQALRDIYFIPRSINRKNGCMGGTKKLATPRGTLSLKLIETTLEA